jgi:tripartite-type tricarboxylate transporter receptor subunit TctC
LSEAGVPGYELVNWYGMFAPAKTPTAVVAALHRETVAALQTPEVQAMFERDGADAVESPSPAAFRKVFEDEVGKWQRYVKLPGFAEALK